MSTLLQLRTRLQEKLNNVGTGDDVLLQPNELDDHINAGIRMIALHGKYELIRPLATVDLNPLVIGGLLTFPDEFMRFWYARSNGRAMQPTSHESLDNILFNQDRAPGAKSQYIYEYDGTRMAVLPASITTVEFHFYKEPDPLAADGALSQLTETGNDMALDWAFGLSLESKGFNPELADRVFTRLVGLLGVAA
jgi:hypothetical protein